MGLIVKASKSESEVLRGFQKGWGLSFFWTIPMAIWSIMVFSRGFLHGSLPEKTAAIITIAFLSSVFLWMMRSGETYRPRRVFFVACLERKVRTPSLDSEIPKMPRVGKATKKSMDYLLSVFIDLDHNIQQFEKKLYT